MKNRILTLVLLALAVQSGAAIAGPNSETPPADSNRSWEINGIRLEADQVERLAENVAKQTVVAVEKLKGLTLDAEQRDQLEAIYNQTALRVYDQAVEVVGRNDLSNTEKEAQIIELVLAGQSISTRQVEGVLSKAQYEIYRDWELRQVESFKTRGLWSSRSKRRNPRRRR